MKRFFFLLPLVALLCSLTAFRSNVPNGNANYIEYHRYANKAYIALLEHRFNDALTLYKKALDQTNQEAFTASYYNDNYRIAATYAGLKQGKSAIAWLRKAILSGYGNENSGQELKTLNQDTLFAFLQNTKQWAAFMADTTKLKQQFDASLDKDTRKMLVDMEDLDQLHRWQLMYGTMELTPNKYPNDTVHNAIYLPKEQKAALLKRYGFTILTPAQEDSIWQIIDKTDSINLNKLYSYIKANGAPTLKKVGCSVVSTFMQHLPDLETIETKWFPLMYEEVKKGNFAPYNLGTMVDYKCLSKYKNQRYGTMNSPKGGLANFTPQSNTDSLRVSIGLPTLADYYKIKELEQ